MQKFIASVQEMKGRKSDLNVRFTIKDTLFDFTHTHTHTRREGVTSFELHPIRVRLF